MEPELGVIYIHICVCENHRRLQRMCERV